MAERGPPGVVVNAGGAAGEMAERAARGPPGVVVRVGGAGGKMAERAARLQEEALHRRERLRALRERRLQNKGKDEGEPETKQLREVEDEKEIKHRELKLRNYVPEAKELKDRLVPNAKPASVEEKVRDQKEAGKPDAVIEEVDLVNLAPRKPDWDLKRDVAKKLEKLEKRTQRAIAELIREKLKDNEEDLASAVGAVKQEDYDSE